MVVWVESIGCERWAQNPRAALREREAQQRLGWYAPVLHDVRAVMVSKMAKPREVLVDVNEDGQVVREQIKPFIRSAWDFDDDYQTLQNVRIAIGRSLT